MAAFVAAATRDDADALATLDKAARGDDDALCEALTTHLRRELAREAPPPPINNASDFPALPAAKKKRVRATLITDAAPPAPPVATPVKRRPAPSGDAAVALGAVVARAARRGDLGATLRLVARAARRGDAAARRLAAAAAAALAPELAALPLDACGRAAELAREVGCRDAAATLAGHASPRPSPRKESAAPRDLSVPFDAARDSRLHHRGREQAYALRERCRDRFLELLRDYEAARRDHNRERLFPPSDDAFFFRKRRQQKHRPPSRDAFRDRASQICRTVPPEHVAWFARVVADIMAQAACAEEHDEDDDAYWAGSPLSTVPAALRIFALFVLGADAKAFADALYEVLAASLHEGVDVDALPRARFGEVLAKRVSGAALLGLLRSAPNFSSGETARPAPLDVVDVLRRVREASDAEIFFAAAYATQFLACLAFDAATLGKESAAVDELAGLRARIVCRAPSPALLAARLDIEASLLLLGRPLAAVAFPDRAPASPASPEPQAAWSPRRAGNGADADLLRSPAASAAARAWLRGGAVPLASPAKRTPSKKVKPQLVSVPAAPPVKLLPPLAATTNATTNAARRALLKPVAAAFFRRHPRARDVAQLAVDTAKARCVADPSVDPGREIAARAGPALELLAPPEQPAAVARVAAALARAHFLEDVVPKLGSSGAAHVSL